MSANEHPDNAALRLATRAAEEEGYYFDGTNVWDCEDLLFHVGRVRDGAEMESMIYAFRQGWADALFGEPLPRRCSKCRRVRPFVDVVSLAGGVEL